jgi:carbon starvation protein
MNSLGLAACMAAGYIVAYHTYGKFLARRVFKINSSLICPSIEFQDNHDFVPTKKHILLGHHFTSIAGLGPIVGPAVAIIWGWVPAVIWIFFGSIFFGAVHDFGALVLSLRSQGRSIGDLTSDVINKRVRILFLLIIFFGLWIVIAVFGLVVALLFTNFPIAVIPVWSQIFIALCLGHLIYKKAQDAFKTSILAVIVMYVTVVIGAYFPVDLTLILGLNHKSELITWIILVLIFNAYLASILPVQTLLQPRDYINSHQLLIAMGLIAIGIIFTHPPIVAPAINFSAKGAPPVWPFIFVIIACGAISGFHSLVSSGTSSKQCDSETSALPIGYGSMLMESVLSVLVIIAVAAGIGLGLPGNEGNVFFGVEAFNHHYATWEAANGLSDKIGAFIQGSANMMTAYGMPSKIALSVMAVFIVSFAATTLDSATRIQRYVIVELSSACKFKPLMRRQAGALFAVVTAALLAFSNGSGQGAMKLWPLFGAVNQLLAGLALLVITIYLARRKTSIIFTAIPMAFMIIMTAWALTLKIMISYANANWLLFAIGIVVFVLQIWMIIESAVVLRNLYSKKDP